MLRAIGYLIVNILVILLLSALLPTFEVSGFVGALLFIIVLTFLNWTIIPILKFLTFPLSFLTFGLVSLLVNLFGILIAANLLSGNGVVLNGGFISELFTALVISVGLSIGHLIVNSLSGQSEME